MALQIRELLTDLIAVEGLLSKSDRDSISTLTQSFAQYSSAIILLPRADGALIRSGLKSARLFFHQRAYSPVEMIHSSDSHEWCKTSGFYANPQLWQETYYYRPGLSPAGSNGSIKLSPAGLPDIFALLGKAARDILDAINISLNLHKFAFNEILDNVPLRGRETSSSVLSVCCNSRPTPRPSHLLRRILLSCLDCDISSSTSKNDVSWSDGLANLAHQASVYGIAAGYCISSSLLSIINKWAVVKFPYADALIALQYFISALAVLVCGRLKALEHDRLDFLIMWKFLPAAIIFSISLSPHRNFPFYDYIQNGSPLDLLHGPSKKVKLDGETCLKIVFGAALDALYHRVVIRKFHLRAGPELLTFSSIQPPISL